MSKGDKKNIMNRRKPKSPQKESLNEVDGRDTFMTPNYATDLLVPYLQRLQEEKGRLKIWECAAGQDKIVRRLSSFGFDIFGTDLRGGVNFLTDEPPQDFNCIVTNPPFSLKKKFYEQCKGYGVDFALLLPADYSSWIVKAVDKDFCQKLIPDRRIDYITPNILSRIHEGEVWETAQEKFPGSTEGLKLEEFKKEFPITWQGYLDKWKDFCKWDSIYDVPAPFLKKYSSSYYHSMWLTRGFNLGRSETFVELTNKQKLEI